MLLVCILTLMLGTAHLAMGVTGTPPINDDCANAKWLPDVSNLAFDTTDATFDGGLNLKTANSDEQKAPPTPDFGCPAENQGQ